MLQRVEGMRRGEVFGMRRSGECPSQQSCARAERLKVALQQNPGLYRFGHGLLSGRHICFGLADLYKGGVGLVQY